MSKASAAAKPRICAVVPAAGRGTRLGVDAPKVFTPILPDLTIWKVLHRNLRTVADHVVLVLSPAGSEYARRMPASEFEGTTLAVQTEPRGMGDAVFAGESSWKDYDAVLVVWGDQFNVSPRTLRACAELYASQRQPAVVLPLVRAKTPYVEYVFDPAGRLVEIRQSREGDACAPNGLADVGTFLMTGGSRLATEWKRHLGSAPAGSRTREVNFLPFLVHLSGAAGWSVVRHEVLDSAEAIGINTPDDLEFARKLLSTDKSKS